MWSGPRLANVMLGLWLLLSAFVWPHTVASQTNTWMLGLIIAFMAAVGTFTPAMRAIIAVPAVWLFISSFWMTDATSGISWNNAIVAILVLVLSLVPTRDRSISGWPQR